MSCLQKLPADCRIVTHLAYAATTAPEIACFGESAPTE